MRCSLRIKRSAAKGRPPPPVGRHRLVYEWQQQELVVLVVRVGHRKDVDRRTDQGRSRRSQPSSGSQRMPSISSGSGQKESSRH